MAETSVTPLFIEFSRAKLLEQYWPRLRGCVDSLTDEQIWWRPHEASNSVGNLMLHLNGNVRQWLISSFNRSEVIRDRRREFSERKPVSKAALLGALGATMSDAAGIFSRLTEGDLLVHFDIQGGMVTGLYAVYAVVEHFGMHYGQILYITKLVRAEGLGFYKELD